MAASCFEIVASLDCRVSLSSSGPVSGDLLEYRERSSPRTHVEHNIYTSTEYPAHHPIFLHNENSYAHTWPLNLFSSVPYHLFKVGNTDSGLPADFSLDRSEDQGQIH